jgi:hypothetical protein
VLNAMAETTGQTQSVLEKIIKRLDDQAVLGNQR